MKKPDLFEFNPQLFTKHHTVMLFTHISPPLFFLSTFSAMFLLTTETAFRQLILLYSPFFRDAPADGQYVRSLFIIFSLQSLPLVHPVLYHPATFNAEATPHPGKTARC